MGEKMNTGEIATLIALVYDRRKKYRILRDKLIEKAPRSSEIERLGRSIEEYRVLEEKLYKLYSTKKDVELEKRKCEIMGEIIGE